MFDGKRAALQSSLAALKESYRLMRTYRRKLEMAEPGSAARVKARLEIERGLALLDPNLASFLRALAAMAIETADAIDGGASRSAVDSAVDTIGRANYNATVPRPRRDEIDEINALLEAEAPMRRQRVG